MNPDKELEKNIARLEAEIEKLKHDLIHDALTGLKTRNFFKERAVEIISSIENLKQEKRKEGFHNFSVLFCDIDNFKEVNDKFGHEGGDDVLKKVSKIIKDEVRAADIVCRWGGEEIVVAVLGADENEAAKKAEEIRVAVEEGIRDIGVTVSIGVACYKRGLNKDSIIKFADQAMYLAKKEWKNKIKTYSDVLIVGKETK